MNLEEKKKIAKQIYDGLGLNNYNLENERDDEINADFIWVSNMRDPGGIIIGDDGNYLLCQSSHDFYYWKDEYKKGIRSNNNQEFYKCHICGEDLMFMMPDAMTLYCKKCDKYFKNNYGDVSEETSYPYTDKNADY